MAELWHQIDLVLEGQQQNVQPQQVLCQCYYLFNSGTGESSKSSWRVIPVNYCYHVGCQNQLTVGRRALTSVHLAPASLCICTSITVHLFQHHYTSVPPSLCISTNIFENLFSTIIGHLHHPHSGEVFTAELLYFSRIFLMNGVMHI